MQWKNGEQNTKTGNNTKKSTAQGGVSYCGGSGWIVIPNANTFASGPFHCALRACSEPNNLTIVCPNPYTTAQNKTDLLGRFVFWWEWVDSNHLRLKPTDLQSAPALQLRRTPNPLVRAAGNRTYKNTMSCVISNELMFAS